MLKDVSFDQLVVNIERVAAGECLPDQFASSKATTTLDPLTPRERDILKYMADGYSNREIAEAIHLSEGTTKNYVSSILAKLNVRDRTQAVLKALERGWVS